MFVVSLNLDVFFKKVFSNKKIAKSFLQDFFGVKITEIKLLRTDYKITDDATIVRFDYRCKINGKYVVIEMQQRYKTDVNKRFYLYHCLGTALQLETLAPKIVAQLNGKTYTEKNYAGLEPVMTLIWMVEDTFNFTDDFVAFTTLPESAKTFIADENLWQQSLETILAEREKTLKIINNKTKDLDFFTENRLIYAFQRNIVNNEKNSNYFKWFDFANKSRNSNNVESDFSKFNNDDIMAEVIKRLKKDKLAPREFKFVSDLYQYENMVVVRDQIIDEKDQIIDEKDQIIDEKDQIIDEMQANRVKSINNLWKLGISISAIAQALEISVEEVKALIKTT
jgi:hypothetical protein